MKGFRRDIKSDKNVDQKAFEISDFDDLVFENRNKEYGAYRLRKRYNRVLLTGILTGSLIAGLSIIIPFIIRPGSEKIISAGRGFVSVQHFETFLPAVVR